METNLNSAPHSVKRWQLSGTDYEPQQAHSLPSETRFSTWTPLNHKPNNLQLFEERMNLVLHWFKLWTDKQRKHLLHSLFTHCTKSQLNRYCRDLLIKTVPVTQVDFTVVLPRFLSLYVMSFLSPRDLSSASQVSWHWKFLAEQDCIWASRCTRRGWFLPYTPGENEFGAWKTHYISCVSTLDWLTPGAEPEKYQTLNQQSIGVTEEQEERRKERQTRQMIREQLQEEKSKCKIKNLNEKLRYVSKMTVLKSNYISSFSESLNKASGALSPFVKKPETMCDGIRNKNVNSSLSAPFFVYQCSIQLVLSGVKAGVTVVLYDHRGTLSVLLTQVQRAICGQRALRLGLLAPGGTEEIHLLHKKTLLTPHHREFWGKLCGWLVPADDGGRIDIFSPLAASGMTLIQALSSLTGLEVWAPMGLFTGGFQSSDRLSNQPVAAPAFHYVCESILQAWCREAKWMEVALEEVRRCLGPQLHQVSLQARGRALGRSHSHTAGLISNLSEALTEGLTALTRQEEVYQEPLTAALNSHRAILSYADMQVILTPVTQILHLNRVFQMDLQARLEQWGAEQCVGDVFVKLCSSLRIYSNYLNNYTTALCTIDKCRETKPAFRAFLRRADRTLATHMMSLQELLLCPVWRIEEYGALLQGLSLHTHPDHPDHAHISSALNTMLRYREFTLKVLHSLHATNLREGNRQLVMTQDAALLRSPDETIPECLRTYEHVSDVGLFLFTDALVLTQRNVHHTPFTLAQRSTHTFLASVSLASLSVREITHTRYVCHAFVLEGPCRSWVCATERGEEKQYFLSAVRSAIRSALAAHR
uniref:Coiled-coil domain containing 28A n=1 Tax=Echeneis naucrates TaxID=173247 RepID=A0A665X397_ECHNA